MQFLRFAAVFMALFCISQMQIGVESARIIRDVDPDENQLEKVQQQLSSAFETLKKNIEEIAKKVDTDQISQGIQSLSTKFEDLTKQVSEQFASATSNTNKPEGS